MLLDLLVYTLFFYFEQKIPVHAWLYVTLTGHKTIRHILGKNESLRSEPKHIELVLDDFASKLLFPS